ncbi:MAG: DNA primase noncatalytic subunit PriX [Nitrososphaeraceae archaeon]
MTKKLGYQKEVFSKDEALQYFKESNYIDCRINAFPSFTDYKGIQRYPPDFIFIDLDRNNFKTEKSLDLALKNTLKNIYEKSDGFPTVLFTGGGYHIYQPIDSLVLETINIFNEFDNPSKEFLRFIKYYLSNNKADKSNNPSFKSCLLRIPFSYNSKFISNKFLEKSQVKIIQEWNGKRPSMKYLLRDFRRYLINQKIYELKQEKKNKKLNCKSINNNNNTIFWIEHLLKTPLPDFRKITIDLVLAPYFINIKNQKSDDTTNIIKNWLIKCNSLKSLHPSMNYFDNRIKLAIKKSINNKIPPIMTKTIQNKYIEWYNILRKSEIF